MGKERWRDSFYSKYIDIFPEKVFVANAYLFVLLCHLTVPTNTYVDVEWTVWHFGCVSRHTSEILWVQFHTTTVKQISP